MRITGVVLPVSLAMLATALVTGPAAGAPPRAPADAPTAVGTVTIDVHLSGGYRAQWTRDPSLFDVHSDGNAILDLGAHYVAPLTDAGAGATLPATTSGSFVPSAALGGAGSFHFTSVHNGGANENGTCDGSVLVAPDAPAPTLTASTSGDLLTLDAQTLTGADTEDADYHCPPATTSFGTDPDWTRPGDKLFYPLDFSAPLPQALTASLRIPSSVLETAGTTSYPVDSSSHPVPSACTVAFQSGGDSCTQSMGWSGAVTITVEREDCPEPTIDAVTDADGHPLSTAQQQALGLTGKHFHPGQVIRTASGQRVSLHMHQRDGSSIEMTMDGGASIELDDECSQVGGGPAGTKGVLERGLIWIKRVLTGGKSRFEVSGPRAIYGVRGSSYTLGKDPKTGRLLMHVLEGDGYAGLPGHKLIDVPAGRSAIVTAKGPRLTDRWPAAQRALVPKRDLPARIGHLRLRHAGHGSPHARLSFRLDRKAKVTVKVRRHGHVVSRHSVHARHGTTRLHPWRHRLKKGSYRIELTVVTPRKAVSLAHTSVRVRR